MNHQLGKGNDVNSNSMTTRTERRSNPLRDPIDFLSCIDPLTNSW